MERLTEKKSFLSYHSLQPVNVVKIGTEEEFKVETMNDIYLVGSAIDKLAEYEDAEEQGLLLRLPTNRVWFICDAKTKYATIMSKTIDDLCIYDIKELLKGNSKRYFMTEEEAEQALAKMKEV